MSSRDGGLSEIFPVRPGVVLAAVCAGQSRPVAKRATVSGAVCARSNPAGGAARWLLFEQNDGSRSAINHMNEK